MKQITITTIFILCAIFAMTTAAAAQATFVVDTTADNGALTACTTAPNDCSLRGAIATANVTTVADTIEFDATVFAGTQTITMIGDHFRVQGGPLTINGTGANRLTINGGAGTNRIFYINTSLLTLQGMTLTGGNGTGDVSPQASAEGGAILSLGSGRLAANEINVTGNTSTSQGGGIYLSNGGRIENSTFSQNQASAPGGALAVLGNSTIINSTFTGNTSGFYGGAISYVNATHTLDSCTITGNTSTNATLNGGGIFLQGTGTLNIGNSIIAGNITPMGNQPEINRFEASFAVTSRGFNLIGDSTGNAASTTNPINYQLLTDIRDTPPQLDPLANYGGTTPTMRLRTGSPAIDKGLSTLPTPLTGLFISSNDDKDSVLLASTRDQRGLTRPANNPAIPDAAGGNGADIGAFEVQLPPTAATASISGRVMSADGSGIGNVLITVSGGSLSEPRTVRTSSFGYYRIEDLEVGATYILTVLHKRYQFAPRIVTLGEDVGEFDFTAE